MKTYIFHCRSKVAPGAVAWLIVAEANEDKARQVAVLKVQFSEWYLTPFPVTQVGKGDAYLLEENT